MIQFRLPAAVVVAQFALAVALNGCEAQQSADNGGPLTKNGCMTCHAANRDFQFAPPFSAISERYSGNNAAADTLLASLRHGTHGKWGQYPGAVMPPQSQLSEEEAKALVQSILHP